MNKGFRYGLLLMLVLLLLFAANLLIGSVSIPARDVIRILLGEEGVKESWRYIVWEARLPQAFTALLSGSALAVCGLLLQTVFRNPLAGTSILGVNSGAGLGVAVVTLLLGGNVTAATFSLSGFFSLLAGAFVGAMAVMDYGRLSGFFGHLPAELCLYGRGRPFVHVMGDGQLWRRFFGTTPVVRLGDVGRDCSFFGFGQTFECLVAWRTLCRELRCACTTGAQHSVGNYRLVDGRHHSLLRSCSFY